MNAGRDAGFLGVDIVVRFRLLGDFEVEIDGRLVDVGHARQRLILAVLLLEINRTVSLDELAGRVWGARPPRRPRDTLYSYLSRLRGVLSDADGVAISRHPGGYVLAADPMTVDVHRFGLLVEEARAAGDDRRALALFDEAIGLWRGRPFAGMDQPWQSEVRESLAHQRLAAELDRNDLRLRAGLHEQVVADHPAGSASSLNERLAAQLILALHRCGRPAEALRHYERVRSRLAEELGVDPSPELRRLHQQLLVTEPVPAEPAGPRQLPEAPESFRGRTRELTALGELLDGATKIAVVTGEAGTGKTWLALRWAQDNADRFPDGHLFVNLRGSAQPADALHRFLGALGIASAAIPNDLDARVALYQSLTARRRLLVVLDDARDSAQVTPLLPGRSCAVVVTSRHELSGLVSAHAARPLVLPSPASVKLVTKGPERESVPRRLPASIADFTGRHTQLAEIKQALTSGTHYGTRIVAISGKGGVGKSTLALRAAHELRDAYPDGQLYADLAAPDGQVRVRGLLARFLRALGVDGDAIPDDVEERADLYRSRLANKRVLVVLDGAMGEDEVSPLLPAGTGCAVLATSRVALPGLPGAHLVDLEVFDADLSLELLGKIVGHSRLRTEPDATDELITLCGGLPLAIRIAGARLASRPHWRVAMLVARLRNSMRRLDELSFRGLVLRSSIGLSYQALSGVAQRLFRRFALITTADFPAWTAAALLDIDPFDALEVVESLIEAQLLETVRYPGETLRYRFHDLIRLYATERLHEEESAAERTATVERLLGAWLARADYAHRKELGGDYTILHGTAPRFPGLEQVDDMGDQIEWLESERRSLVSAVHLAADHDMTEACWDLAFTAVTLFEVKGHFDDWRETTERALAACEAADNRRGQAVMLYSLGTLHSYQIELADAERRYAAALEIFENLGDEHGMALALRNMATNNRMLNQNDTARVNYQLALEKMRAVGDQVGEAHILQSMAKMCIDAGDADTAREKLETALELFRRTGFLRGEAQALTRVAELHLLTNQPKQAHEALNRVLLIVRGVGDRIGEAHALCQLGVVRQRTGQFDNAETSLRHALSLAEQFSQRVVAGRAHHALDEIAVARGHGR